MNYLIDTHSHINMIEERSLEEILQQAKENNVKKIIVPSAYPSDIETVYNLSQKYEEIVNGFNIRRVRRWYNYFFYIVFFCLL